jgi:hypothetical protein
LEGLALRLQAHNLVLCLRIGNAKLLGFVPEKFDGTDKFLGPGLGVSGGGGDKEVRHLPFENRSLVGCPRLHVGKLLPKNRNLPRLGLAL